MTKERGQEADKVTTAFHLALTQIGAQSIEELLVLWAAMPSEKKAEQSRAWLDDAVHLVMTRRSLSVQVGIAYYRLVRALRTGTTVADPSRVEPRSITLAKLRYEFAQLAGPSLDDAQNDELLKDYPTQAPQEEASEDGSEPSSERDKEIIAVEVLDTIADLVTSSVKNAEREARELLEVLGPLNEAKLRDALDDQQSAEKVDRLRAEANVRAGARQAAAGERIVINGGRSWVWLRSENDPRTIGYIRVSMTGTPCGWCAMLISRGPTYKSSKSASTKSQKAPSYKGAAVFEDGNKYHDNCHCIAVPVFGDNEYEESDSYALNREYAELWPKVTKGLFGKAALAAWRKHFRTKHEPSVPAT